jgi:hypothetical protein
MLKVDARPQDPADASIGDLFHKLVDDGKTLVGAEVNLYKQIASYRAAKAKNGVIALVVGGVLALTALIALMVGIMMDIGDWLDSFALGGLIVLAVTGLVAFLLFRWGAGKMGALSGDEEERQALRQGESRA